MVRRRRRILPTLGASGDGSLSDVIPSTVFDLEATKSGSYGGTGQTWANLATVPADGSAQTDYDFYLGVDGSSGTDDPTFTGTAGDSAAYFLYDGGDRNVLAGTPPEFIMSTHQTSGTGSGPSWYAVALRFGSTGLQVIYSNATGLVGVEIFIINDTTVRFNFKRNGVTTNNDFTVPTLTNSTDYLLIFSVDPTGTDDIRFWLNNRTAQTDTDGSADTSAASSTDTPTFAARSNGSFGLTSGTRVYGFSMGNGYLDNTEAGLLFDAYNTRHGRTYA